MAAHDQQHVHFELPAEPYERLIERARDRFPTLNFLYDELSRQGPQDPSGRAAVVEQSTGNHAAADNPCRIFTSSASFEAYLNPPAQQAQPAMRTRTFVLEDISKSYIKVLASHLKNYLDATVLASHLRMRDSTHFVKSNAPTLQSLNSRKTSFSVQYQELHLGVPRSSGTRPSGNLFASSNVYREILVADTTHSNVAADLAIVPRKATFWSYSESNSHWTGVLLLDPPLGRSVIRGKSKYSGEAVDLIREDWFPRNGQYQGGYIDTEGWPLPPQTCGLDDVSTGPPRESALGDFLFHWQRSRSQQAGQQPPNAGQAPEQQQTQDAVRKIVEKLAISNWIVLIEYLRHKFFQLEIATQEGTTLEDLDARKEVHRWRRSCAVFIEQVRASTASLKGSLVGGGGGQAQKLDEGWDYVLDNLVSLRGRMDDVAQSSVALLGVLDSHKSLKEAQDVGRLTRLGMIFLPLSLTAALFSMASDWQPGSAGFWVFFAVGIPFTVVVLLLSSVAYLWHVLRPTLSSVVREKMPELAPTRLWRAAHGIESLDDLEKTLHPERKR